MNAIKFSNFVVTKQVFYQTKKSFALVNIRPILPGHVLVCPFRRITRVSELTAEEASDFFLCVQTVSKVIEKVYEAQSLNIAIQDGPLAGQTVPHVHCHIIPRSLHDLPDMDDVYKLLDSPEADLDAAFNRLKANRPRLVVPDAAQPQSLRSEEEMEKEATLLAKFF